MIKKIIKTFLGAFLLMVNCSEISCTDNKDKEGASQSRYSSYRDRAYSYMGETSKKISGILPSKKYILGGAMVAATLAVTYNCLYNNEEKDGHASFSCPSRLLSNFLNVITEETVSCGYKCINITHRWQVNSELMGTCVDAIRNADFFPKPIDDLFVTILNRITFNNSVYEYGLPQCYPIDKSAYEYYGEDVHLCHYAPSRPPYSDILPYARLFVVPRPS